MKMKTKLKSLVFTLLIVVAFLCQTLAQEPAQNTTEPQQPKNQTSPQNQTTPNSDQQKPLNYLPIQLDRPYKQQLSSNTSFTQKYRVKINPNKVDELKEEKWFFFVEVQTTEEFEWEKTKIQLFSINAEGNEKPLKQCETINGLDSCFLTSNNFNYKTESIQAKVTCEQYCEFTISAQLSTKYKLEIDKPVQLDFENTAYSKLFTVDTSSMFDFKRLQIIVKPKGFLSFNAPIRLYANKGDTIPTREKHDYTGIHLWDDGLGLFINYPDGSAIFTVLIEGPEQNILILQANVIYEDKPIVTTKYEPSFAYIQAQQKLLFQINIEKTQNTFIKLTTFTGAVQIGDIFDQSKKLMKSQFAPETRTYGEYEYKFSPAFFQKNKEANVTNKLYIQVKAFKDSTFFFESYTNNEEMSYLISQINRYVEFEKNGVDMYFMRLYQFKQNINEKNQNTKIDLMTTTYDDVKLNPKLFTCKSNVVKECQPNKEQIQKIKKGESIDNTLRKELKNITKDTSIPGVEYHNISINYNDFLITESYYQMYVIVVVINPVPDKEIVYTLQYIDLSSMYFLKQKELKKDRLSIDQTKYYTFVNNDKDVKQIKIHATEISGEILMVGYKQDPREQDLEGKQVYEYHGSVTFLDVKPGQQFYLVTQGIDNAYYSLYLQLIRQSQKEPDDKGGNQGYNQIIIQMDTSYDFFIKPKDSIIVQMHANDPKFQLILGAHLPLQVCMTENMDKAPFKPNCEIKQTISKNTRQTITMDKGLIGMMGITNNNDKAVEFKIQMKNIIEEATCKQSCPGMMNKFTLQVNKKDQNSTSNNTTDATNTSNTTIPAKSSLNCYKINIRRRENIEIMVQLENMLYENTTVTWQLNSKEKQIMLDTRHLIWKKQLVKVCGENQKDLCELIVTIESNYSTGGILLVQYLDKDIILLQGIAQPAFMKKGSEQPKNFRYELINLVNTTIILQNKMGFYHFYGHVMSRIDFMKESNRTSLFPTQQKHLFKSQNPFYYGVQSYILTEDTLKNSTCKNQCVLLISVYPGDKRGHSSDQEDMGHFVIEVSQEDRFLKDNQPIIGYLQRGSIAFYEFYNPQKGTIFLQLNNQNMKCARIFVKKGNQTRALPSSYDKTADDNTLIFEDADQGPYSIAIESKQHWGCSYTIQAMSSIAKIQKIRRGVFSDRTLQANQTYHFLYQNFRKETFKVMTLSKIGEVMIKVKVLYEGDLNKLLEVNGSEALRQYLQKLTYQESGVDFVKVRSDALYFCLNCTYLISVTANKYTETSVIIPSNNVQVPIATNALIKDQIEQNETIKYRIFTSNIAKYQINVQYGQINLTLTESVSKKVVFTKIYNQTKEPIYQVFNSSISQEGAQGQPIGYGYDFIHYSSITIEGLANSSFYSFELLAQADEEKVGNIKYGIPEYIYLQENKTKCFKGIIDDDQQEFILSFSNSDNETVKALSINCQVNDKKVVHQSTYALTEMTLEIQDLKLTEPASFEICLTSRNSISLTFIQSAHIIMVPSNTAVLLTHSTNVTFGAIGQTVMEVDECSKRSVISVSSTFNDLHTTDSEIQQIRRANNLVQFSFYGPVYVHIETQGTRIRWRSKDIYKEQGVGYDKFMAATAKAFKEGDNIKIQVQPIQQIGTYKKTTNLTISSVKYKVILGRYDKQVMGALNCHDGESNLIYEHEAQQLNSNAIAIFPINAEMINKYSQSKFFMVGVIANLNIEVNGVLENYRFVYPMIQIQREVLFGGDIKPIIEPYPNPPINKDNEKITKNDQSINYLLILIGLIVLTVSSYFIYQKCVKRWLRTRKQKLSDQASGSFKYTQFAQMG